MLGGRAAEAVYPVLPLPLYSHIDKQDGQAEFFAQTRHGAQTQQKRSEENPYPSVNLTKTLKEKCGTETGCTHPQGDAPPIPRRWGKRRMMMLFKAQPSSGAEKTQCVAPSSSVLSSPRAETSSAVLHTNDQKPCCSVQHNLPSFTLPLIQRKTQELLEHHRCPKMMPSPSCIFYERNGQ